jgi:hypothetical protein
MTNKQKTAKLRNMLQTAVQLELSTIPPYMVALLSIHPDANSEAANLIRGVMMEEMLHLALVANVTNAVGGTPIIDRNRIPSYPLQMNFEGQKFKDRDFPVNLARFSKENISTFMKIEEPQDLAARPKARAMTEINIPGLTIGQFYLNIIALLEELNEDEDLFTGDASRQLIDNYYWGGGAHIIPVSDLDSAKRALDIVIRQGEGAWRQPGVRVLTPEQPLFMGHYYRYAEIYYKRHYNDADDPAKPPTGTPLPVDYKKVYPIKTNPKSSDYNRTPELATLNAQFNARYTEMLQQLAQGISGTPKTLYTAIMNGMHTIAPIASQMMCIPIKGDRQKTTGCPTFEWWAGR